MDEELLNCNHCGGTGTCRAAGESRSCDECRAMAAGRAVVDNSALTLVTCSRCDGLGKRDLNHEQTRYSFQLQKLVSRPEPKVSTQGRSITEEDLEQLKLVSDYIKFHMGLYLATPPVLVILAEGLGVTNSGWWVGSLLLMILVYAVSGAHAGLFMGKFINHPWRREPEQLKSIRDAAAYTKCRRFFHHWLYWGGLAIGLTGLLIPVVEKWV